MVSRKTIPEIETELKIQLSSEDLEKVFLALSGKAGTSKVAHKFMPRQYYDTDALDLYNHNISLRVQYKAGKNGVLGGYEQTVKIEQDAEAGKDKDVFCRKECKDWVSTHQPDLNAVTDTQAQQALVPIKGKSLKHIFTAAIERRYFEWNSDKKNEKGTVEIAFDVGQVILPGNIESKKFFEIEIEVKKGDSKLIDVVKKEILRIAPSARVQPLSKAAQGTQFYLNHKI